MSVLIEAVGLVRPVRFVKESLYIRIDGIKVILTINQSTKTTLIPLDYARLGQGLLLKSHHVTITEAVNIVP